MAFRPTSFEQAKEHFKPMKRVRAPLRCHRPMKRKSGKKGKEWESVRRRLKVLFEARGITTCELGFIEHECWRDNGLSFAHAHKRRDPNFDIWVAALACPPAHQILDEVFSHAEMAAAVMKAIERHGGLILP